MHRQSEQAAVLAIGRRSPETMPATVALLSAAGSAWSILDGSAADALDDADAAAVKRIAAEVHEEDLGWAERQIASGAAAGARLATVLDDYYPANLHDIYDRPPFLFYRGGISVKDRQAIAVVGTRHSSDAGQREAYRLAADLAGDGVTVVSGLAVGIDTAAHRGALDAGGRTIAVFGTGVRRVYPAENRELAERIVDQGATVSQFWPDSPPTKQTFPRRNVVTSGLSLATVVIEAHGHSGASQQARHCLRHGRTLLLFESLVAHESWAHRLVGRPGVRIVRTADDVLRVLEVLQSPLDGLAFG